MFGALLLMSSIKQNRSVTDVFLEQNKIQNLKTKNYRGKQETTKKDLDLSSESAKFKTLE